jgi:DNA-binding NarL/FixJ family response regulator
MKTDTPPQPVTVLLADDHAVVRDGLRALLEAQADLRVVGDASNGRDAVRQAEALQPDVVVIDIAMPELNGIDAIARIREASPATQVVILSVHADSEHIFRALQAGARGYVMKESAGQEVVQAIRTVHSGHRHLSARVADTVTTDFVRLKKDLPHRGPLASLSAREREVLQLVAEGRSNAEMAARLSLSVKTVETYRSRLMLKLGIHDVPGLVRFSILHGLTPG